LAILDKLDPFVNFNLSRVSTLDSFFTYTQPINSKDRAITNTLYGLNTGGKNSASISKTVYGKVFFTRPQLNLTNNNLANVRSFYNMLGSNSNSAHGHVRRILDPRLSSAVGSNSIGKSALVDEENCFIPLLSNSLLSLSGWPDPIVPTYESKEGMRGQRWGIADGSMETYGSYDINATFNNVQDDTLLLLFDTWTKYMSLIYEGKMTKYMDFIAENEIDYQTRIYVLILDETLTHVKYIAATGASFPINMPLGGIFDVTADSTVYNDRTRTVPIRFKSFGAMYNEDILMYEFNQAVGIFSPGMRVLGTRDDKGTMEKVPKSLLQAVSNRAYPRINTANGELEWWIKKNSHTYRELVKIYSKG